MVSNSVRPSVSSRSVPLAGQRDPKAHTLRQLVHRMREAIERRDPRADCEIYETHISIVLLAGAFAYKFKKPVDFGFVDFSTLAKRRHFCQREVDFNRRTAPDLYVGVEAVAYRDGLPVFDAKRAPIEYAVKMRRFANDARLDRMVASGAVGVDEVRTFANTVAAFHARAERAGDDERFGSADVVRRQVLDAFGHLEHVDRGADLESQTSRLLDRTVAAMTRRKVGGFVRQCHGDLHLSNVVKLSDRLAAFDCIEFNDELSWIDTCSDVAFMIMDLDMRGEDRMANAFLNRYFDVSGDYSAIELLRGYLVYRTLVRAKVAQLEIESEEDAAARKTLTIRRDRHLALAARYLTPRGTPTLTITHGFSGSGKSYVSDALAIQAGFFHVRSDRERRRLADLTETQTSGSPLAGGLYDVRHTERTYGRLLDIADTVVRAGYSVIVDATFLSCERRQRFRQRADELGVPFRILHCEAPEPLLRERIATRSRSGRDPSEASTAVLAHQLGHHDLLSDAERACVVDVHAIGVGGLSGDMLVRLGGPCR